jgi:hypothetical protein
MAWLWWRQLSDGARRSQPASCLCSGGMIRRRGGVVRVSSDFSKGCSKRCAWHSLREAMRGRKHKEAPRDGRLPHPSYTKLTPDPFPLHGACLRQRQTPAGDRARLPWRLAHHYAGGPGSLHAGLSGARLCSRSGMGWE